MEPEEWPFDLPDYVFLPRALEAIGRAVFPGGWEQEREARRRAIQIVAHKALAIDLIQSATRACLGGPFRPMTYLLWNTEQVNGRFTRFKIDASDPFGNGGLDKWIFVVRPSLEFFCASIARARQELLSERAAAERAGIAGEPHAIARLEWPWANSAEVAAAFAAYVADMPKVKHALAEQHLIEGRLGKRIETKAFRSIRKELTGANLGPGPKPADYRHSPRK